MKMKKENFEERRRRQISYKRKNGMHKQKLDAEIEI